jgi:hypothetical protein
MPINNQIINQKGTPAFFSDIFANRPAFGYAGRVFISTDTGAIYEDTGTSWTLIADAGAGTTGTLQQVTTNGNTTTLGIVVQGININDGAGTGANNIAIGTTALSLNTTGFSNTAVGSLSLPANTTGNYNTALGMQSLYNNSTGANNTALGQGALALNTTASNNTAVGNASLSANTTGASNTAIGSSALNGNTTASFNTAIGYQSLYLNTTGASNTAVGSSALQNNTTGTLNTALGTNSLISNTTGVGNTALGSSTLIANTTGGNNTAVGNASLQNNTTGTTNVAVGNATLTANTTGSNNTALGYFSLAANTTGASNTALGYLSLAANTTGANNVGIGQSSLTANTTGFSNVGIGSRALTANTTGAQNVAIGTDALYINTTGNTNTAIGTAALSLNTTGGGNTAIGTSALNSNTTANFNTAVGGSSLAAITTGTLNTAIGYLSGSAITTGSNNTILGAYAGTTTLANNIVLSDGNANVRLFSDANGLIGINQAVGSVPGGQLDIHTAQTYALVLNGLTTNNAYTAFSNNSVGKWRIGNTYNAGANTFNIFNLGTSINALNILSSNSYVGISTITPVTSLHVVGGTASPSLSVDGGVNTFGSSSSVQLQTGFLNASPFTAWMQVKQSSNSGSSFPLSFQAVGGNVLIGSTTDDTTNKLQVNGNSALSGNVIVNGTSTPYSSSGRGNVNINGATGSDSMLSFSNNNSGKGYILHNGSELYIQNTTTSPIYVTANTNGVYLASGGVAWIANSDEELKTDLKPIENAINKILKLRSVTGRYKTDNIGTSRSFLIAQDVISVLPEAVNKNEISGMLGVAYSDVIPLLVASIKEQQKQIEELKIR